ncbi:MAG: PAS domain-containing protein, partial [Chloroflexota bacterium]
MERPACIEGALRGALDDFGASAMHHSRPEPAPTHLGRLRAIGRRLIEADSQAEILEIAYQGIREDYGYDRVTITLFDRETDRFERCVGTDAQGHMLRPIEPISGRTDTPWRFPSVAALLGGAEVYYTVDAAAECPAELRYLFDGAPKHYLAVPLRSVHRVIGMISVDNLRSGRSIQPEAADPLLVFAHQISMALENARPRERERHEDSRRTMETERLRILYATMSCGVLVRAASGVIVDANTAAQEILGLPLDLLCGCPLSDALVETSREDGAPLLSEERPVSVAFRTGRPQRGSVMRVTRNDGRQCWLQVDAVP